MNIRTFMAQINFRIKLCSHQMNYLILLENLSGSIYAKKELRKYR